MNLLHHLAGRHLRLLLYSLVEGQPTSLLPGLVGSSAAASVSIADHDSPRNRRSDLPHLCGLSIEDKIQNHSAFSRARNERFRDSDIFRRVFERVVERCIVAGLVGSEGFAVDASLIVAYANKQRSIPGKDWDKRRDPATASRAVKEYVATLDDAAFGAASDVTPKFVSPSNPAVQWTGAMRGPAFFAYADNYLIDVKLGIIMDVKASAPFVRLRWVRPRP